MTDRINALVIILKEPMREDDAESLKSAIRMLRNVESVEGNVETHADSIARLKVTRELKEKLYKVIDSL